MHKQALTKLTRICQTDPDHARYLRAALEKYLTTCALPALMVAQETGDPIGQILAECIANTDNSDLLLEIYELLPTNTIALREVHAVITRRLATTAKTLHSDNWELIAEATASYATALSDLGERETALIYAQESACLYQRHATDQAVQILQSLSQLGECYMQVGQLDNALLLQTEVLEGYQALYEIEPSRHMTQCINTLLIISSYHKMQECFSEAVEWGIQADQLIKKIANPSLEHIYIQHRITNNLAECYEQLNQLDKAADLLRDTLQVIRDLNDHATDRYGIELIDTLETLATIESRQGNQEAAESAASEAIDRMEDLYRRRPQAFASHYAKILINMALVDLRFAGLKPAHQKMNLAISVLEPLYQQLPTRFATNLAALLNNRVEVQLALADHESAIRDAHRALCLYHSQPEQDANVAMTLNTLGNARMRSGDIFRAQRSLNACIRIYRRLAVHDENYLPELATALGTQAAISEQEDDYPAALVYAEEAL